MSLYSIDEFTEKERLYILDIALQVCKDGQDKKKNKNPMSRTICKAMDDMFNQIFIRIAEEREGKDEEGQMV